MPVMSTLEFGQQGNLRWVRQPTRERSSSAAETECLFHSERENPVAANLHFDSEWRPQVRALHNGALHPDIARQIGHPRWVEECAAARIANHRMSRCLEIVVRLQFRYIRHVFQFAVPISRFHGQRPVASRLCSRSIGQPDQQSRNVLARERVFIEKLLAGPGLRHFRKGGYLRIRFRGSRNASGWVGCRRRDLNLRRRLGRRRRWLLCAQKKTRTYKENEQRANQGTEHANRRIAWTAGWSICGNTGDCRHFWLEAVWLLVSHEQIETTGRCPRQDGAGLLSRILRLV